MTLFATLALALTAAAAPAEQINPFPRLHLADAPVAEWRFTQGTEGWTAEHDCSATAEAGLLRIQSRGEDPYLHRAVQLPGGDMLLVLRALARGGDGSVFWTTEAAPRRDPAKSRSFPLEHDGQWHEYRVDFPAPGTLTDVRIDPGTAPGLVEIESVRLLRRVWHPLSIDRVDLTDRQVRFRVVNHEAQPVRFTAFGRTHTAPAQAAIDLDLALRRAAPLEPVTLELAIEPSPAAGGAAAPIPRVTRTVFAFHSDIDTDWIARPLGPFTLEIARDGSVARIRRDGQTVGAMAPLVHREGRVPALRLVAETPSLRFEGDGVSLTLSTSGQEIAITLQSQEPCEGPVIRALGNLQGGVLAGLEYLGKGDASSSRLDIENERHLRFAPDPLHLTFPFMSLVTDRAALAMTWSDTALQPRYATPNFFDGGADHRMALAGTKISATVLVDRTTVESTILWAVKRLGLPPLPSPPRTRDAQWELCLKALAGPLKTADGWGHCAEPHWGRAPHADMYSTLYRLTGKVPEASKLVPGGSHVPNDAIYFVSGRAQEWLEVHKRQAEALAGQQQPDGSYRYGGPLARGHFEDTALGVCARPAALLLEFARTTGDRPSLQAALRTLDYMKRFDVPRGAQVWEIPLHTPDQLASAYAVWAYVRGYELTGRREYLEQARRWALSGLPFVYLWSRYPIMLYATPPVFGATQWQAPVWIGLPVQWVGGVYAYALTMLAPHDASLDWNHLARGILLSAEQQQFPDGPWVGLLPDSVELRSQERRPWRINPCAVVSLRLVLDGEVDFLTVAADGGHRVAAPFPVTLRAGQARIRARKGLTYQVLVDGKPVQIVSQGEDVLAVP